MGEGLYAGSMTSALTGGYSSPPPPLSHHSSPEKWPETMVGTKGKMACKGICTGLWALHWNLLLFCYILSFVKVLTKHSILMIVLTQGA